MKKLILLLLLFFSFFFTEPVFADESAAITNGLDYLRSKQDDSGRITTGFSAPSQWSTLAFTTNSIDITTVKKSTYSLYDFLLTDTPLNNAATDYETRILAIVAVGGNPASFNGTNYIAALEGMYTQKQLGDVCSLNDDIFGLLSLIASGKATDMKIKQHVLEYLISKQDADGGFSFSAPGCDWYSTSADMTGAGLQALSKAKENNITAAGLDNAIEKAKNYLLTNQNADGGFGYFGSSDADSTGWVLIGLNALGMSESEEANQTKAYLLSQQSNTDGGFMTFDWGSNTLASNATTTAHAVIALSGKTWIEKIYESSSVASEAATVTSLSTQTPTTQPSLTSIDQQSVLYQTITITTTPSPKKISSLLNTPGQNADEKPTVLGTKTASQDKPKQKNTSVITNTAKNPAFLLIAAGSFCLAIYFLLSASSFRKK